jgi:hypothetical protein
MERQIAWCPLHRSLGQLYETGRRREDRRESLSYSFLRKNECEQAPRGGLVLV